MKKDPLTELRQQELAQKTAQLLIDPAAFKGEIDGLATALYTLRNSAGCVAQITNYGAKLVSLIVPDRNGDFADVVLGYDSIDRYVAGNADFGATVGRYANRIANAAFSLNGKTYSLAKNEPPNTLHGGEKSFRHVVWKGVQSDGQTLALTYYSKDGEEGYPGNLAVRVVYSLTEENALKIEYQATTDQETVINLTNHAFFNLAGQACADVLAQTLQINASSYTRVGKGNIPTGEIASIEGTPLDFRQETAIGARITADFEELHLAPIPGYDQNFVLDKKNGELDFAARMIDRQSGRVMELYTTEPGLQIYSAQHSTGEGKFIGKGGAAYRAHGSLCLEAQHFPDSPNQPNFPSTVLRVGEWYTQTTIYKFSTINE